MRHPLATLLLALLATPVLAGAPTTKALRPEDSERVAFKMQIREMLRLGQFDELERTARSLIADDPRYSCGVSKLVDFHTAMDPIQESGPNGFDAMTATFTAWSQAKPSSYLPKVGFAYVESSRAWKARGNGFSREVSPEGWDGFHRHMKAAMEWGRKALADGET